METYPLVPPSTILGLISTLLKKELENNCFNISIQGNYGSLMRDYQWYKKYDEEIEGYKNKPYPLLVHSLFDNKLLLHICVQDQEDTSTLNLLYNMLKNPPYFLYLGRAEDIVKINEIKIVDVQKEEVSESQYLQYDAYLSIKDATTLKISGIEYNLTSYSKLLSWTINNQTKIIRDFNWVNVFYIEKGSMIEIEQDSNIRCWKDGENFIWWCLPNPPQ